MKINSLQEAKQAAFNGAFKGLRSQKWRRSRSPEGYCSWRGNNNRKCAIGWLIPDKNLTGMSTPSMTKPFGRGQCQWLADPISRWAEGQHDLFDLEELLSFLGDIQSAHDKSKTPKEMRAAFVWLSLEHNLTIPGPSRSSK